MLRISKKDRLLIRNSFLLVGSFVAFPICVIVIASGFSNGKLGGKTSPFLEYTTNYQYTCFEGSNSITDCEIFIERVHQEYGEELDLPIISSEALTGAFDIPLVGDLFPIQVCVEMEPFLMPHKALIELDKRNPGISNLNENKVLIMKIDRNPTCEYVNIDQDSLTNSQFRQISNDGEVTNPPIDESTAKLLLKLNNGEAFDDHNNVSSVTYTIQYTNLTWPLVVIWIASISATSILFDRGAKLFLYQKKLCKKYYDFFMSSK